MTLVYSFAILERQLVESLYVILRKTAMMAVTKWIAVSIHVFLSSSSFSRDRKAFSYF